MWNVIKQLTEYIENKILDILQFKLFKNRKQVCCSIFYMSNFIMPIRIYFVSLYVITLPSEELFLPIISLIMIFCTISINIFISYLLDYCILIPLSFSGQDNFLLSNISHCHENHNLTSIKIILSLSNLLHFYILNYSPFTSRCIIFDILTIPTLYSN